MKNHLDDKFPLYLKHAQQRDAGTGELKLNPYPLLYNQGPAEAFWSLPREEWDWSRHLGLMAPMAGQVWMESQPAVPLSSILTRLPEHRIRAMEAQRRMEQGSSYVAHPHRKIASLVTSRATEEMLEARWQEAGETASRGIREAKERELAAEQETLDGVRWVHEVQTWVETSKGFSQSAFPVVQVMADDTGMFLRRTPSPDAPMMTDHLPNFNVHETLSYERRARDTGAVTDFRQFAVDAAFAAMYTLSLANARNISLYDEQGRVGSRQLRKELGGDGEKDHTYSVIRLDRPGAGAATSQGGSDPGRLHFVRGHFKTYTNENKLMGQHVGTFFWSHHARGDRGKGEVQAHYEL